MAFLLDELPPLAFQRTPSHTTLIFACSHILQTTIELLLPHKAHSVLAYILRQSAVALDNLALCLAARLGGIVAHNQLVPQRHVRIELFFLLGCSITAVTDHHRRLRATFACDGKQLAISSAFPLSHALGEFSRDITYIEIFLQDNILRHSLAFLRMHAAIANHDLALEFIVAA